METDPTTVPKEEKSCRMYQVEADCFVYRLIVIFLGAVTGIALLGSFWLTVTDVPIPDIFLAFGSGALGALAGLLAPPPRRQGGDSHG